MSATTYRDARLDHAATVRSWSLYALARNEPTWLRMTSRLPTDTLGAAGLAAVLGLFRDHYGDTEVIAELEQHHVRPEAHLSSRSLEILLASARREAFVAALVRILEEAK